MTTTESAAIPTAYQFTKKPVTIEAFQFAQSNNGPIPYPDWFDDAVTRNDIITHGTGKWSDPTEPCYCEIKTLEGVMRAEPGDWIIRGLKGELYPCKADIFAMSYSAATPALPVPGTTGKDINSSTFARLLCDLNENKPGSLAGLLNHIRKWHVENSPVAALAVPASVPQSTDSGRILELELLLDQSKNDYDAICAELQVALEATSVPQPAAQGAVRDLLEDLSKFGGKGGMVTVNKFIERAIEILRAEQSTDKSAEGAL